ncbi:hypothetical protein DACRYDRAFT_56765 [Dacryopinax primogenitus]|uniref:Glutamine amidotransferase type-2 domain-containing protein n=1 Tax=Dacryopinax primogenitus (strain DJM 731) TaxID=1858805 RepID=M5FQ37_DACPD|nr:uncharacterized protein DACRYDRAFT_56765 [Dacryopinax primogenitus]EJT98955.1 hypothetical protein DACRYDRAFT_56765 [Dacryopinax primogenitus]
MCGIVFSLRWCPTLSEGGKGFGTEGEEDRQGRGEADGEEEEEWARLCALNAHRGTAYSFPPRPSLLRPLPSDHNPDPGPDHQAEHTVNLALPGCSVKLRFFSSVLHLRGELTPQPLRLVAGGDVLCWNGEVFEGLPVGDENDTAVLFRALQAGDVHSVLGQVEGPYAFVYLDRGRKKLYFARDPLGRRSLLLHQTGESLLLASSGLGKSLTPKEVDPLHIQVIDLSSLGRGLTVQVLEREGREEWRKPMEVNRSLPGDGDGVGDEELQESVRGFLDALERSVRLRVEHIPRINRQEEGQSRVAVLFSGGVDCTLLAALVHRCLPIEESIDLLNVAFENPRKLLAEQAGKKKYKSAGVTTPGEADRPLPGGEETDKYTVPDRLTGLDAWSELRSICPGRTWNLVAIDVPCSDCIANEPLVRELMYPSETVMDLSLGNALFWAARGRGKLVVPADAGMEGDAKGRGGEEYESPARVLLSGLGADEQLAGYARHRRAFERLGWAGLVEELQTDISRLPTRNLGRDDRVISYLGKEVRYPYLSLDFVAFLSRLPVEWKVRLDGEGGDKWVLREAAERLGLKRAAGRKKRAMQFGSRSARMDQNAKKGYIKLDDL